jgi:dipeptidase D
MDKTTKKIIDKLQQINRNPRCSKDETRISRWIEAWANDRGFAIRKDAAGNICIDIPATAGYENTPILIIQGHMDMVCEKTKDSGHDFSKDPIRLVYDGDWLKADGTSLGADNGIALAMALELAEDDTTVHPPLELLFTVNEESGLIGAKDLDADLFKGHILLNIDSEEEGEFTVGCAGGQDTRIRLGLRMGEAPDDHQLYDLTVRGLTGGHSGIDIQKHRASANKLLARGLLAVNKAADSCIVSLKGGTVHNAIARDATACITCHPNQADRVQQLIAALENTMRSEYAAGESSLGLAFSPAADHSFDGRSLTPEDTLRVIHLLQALPHGVADMSADIEGLVETSNNLATVEIADGTLNILSSQRSSVMSRLEEITSRIESTAALTGAATADENSYPAWQPDMTSPLLKHCTKVYNSCFGKDPVVQSIHAGLECGIIGAKKTGMDMISFGPTIENPHSPEEKLYIPSIARVWEFLIALLESYTH